MFIVCFQKFRELFANLKILLANMSIVKISMFQFTT
uniref:Uncharacterized protein n=1 Tax=Siphoviridae sp. ctbbV81 TaxID=2827900 RepID=A0A8S5TQP4_9CAUD|nr:MAG TPA: hypothetical protein [Siphoviridae sp. ctbbV81]